MVILAALLLVVLLRVWQQIKVIQPPRACGCGARRPSHAFVLLSMTSRLCCFLVVNIAKKYKRTVKSLQLNSDRVDAACHELFEIRLMHFVI